MLTYIDYGRFICAGDPNAGGEQIIKHVGSSDYARVLASVAAGTAKIVPCTLPPAPPPPRVLHPEDFRALLTDAEVDAIATATNAAIIKWRFRAATAKAINLDAASTATLLAGAVTLGILTQARADRILTGLPPE